MDDDLPEPPALMIRPVVLAPGAKTYTAKEWREKREEMKTKRTKFGLITSNVSPDHDAYIEKVGDSLNPYGNEYHLSPLFAATLFDTEEEAKHLKVSLGAYIKFKHLEPDKLTVIPIKVSHLEE